MARIMPLALCALAGGLFLVRSARGQPAVEAELRALAGQNQRLQEQVQAQQKQIEALAAQLKTVRQNDAAQDQSLRELRETSVGPASSGFRRDQEVRISGEAELAFFHTGLLGSAPNGDFRVGDAKLFVESPVMKDVYFYGELDLTTREADDANPSLGELYVDFENVSGRLGGRPRLLNVRAGAIYVPFGEEYQVRGPVADPLISHSLADIWGVDNGVEAYGELGAWYYAVAVQNGGSNPAHDFNADKAVTARLGYDPASWLHLSASAMRTGELHIGTTASPADNLSAVWFGNGFFRSVGGSATTSDFWTSVWEGDAVARWKGTRLAASAGGVRYGDNDRSATNARTLHFGFVEAMQPIADGLFGAVRHSWIEAPRGYPLVGWGGFGRYFFAPPLTTHLQRTSVGLGYRFGPPLVLKLEYAWESGRLTNGAARDQEDFFGAEAGLKF